MSALTAEQIRQGLRLPNNEAGRAVAEAMVERPGDVNEIEGFLSADELADNGRIMSAFRQLSPQQQADILTPLAAGLRAPVTINGRRFQVSSYPGSNLSGDLEQAAARLRNPPPATAIGPMALAGPAQNIGRELVGHQVGMMVDTGMASTGMLLVGAGVFKGIAAAAGGAIAAGTFPVWGTAALIGTGLVIGGIGAYRLYNRLTGG